MSKPEVRTLLLVLTVTLVFRAVWVWRGPGPFGGDEPVYHALAVQLLEGKGFVGPGEMVNPSIGAPTAHRNPGLPVVLALIYRLSGQADYQLARVILAVLTSLTAPAICALTLLLFAKRSLAILAALAWTSLQITLQHSAWLYAEALATCLLTVALVLVAIAGRNRSLLLAGMAGLLFGYAALCRVHLLPMVLGPAVWLLIRRARSQALVLILTAATLPVGWAVRNYVQLGVFALGTQSINIWLGNNAWARGSWSGDWPPQHAFMVRKYPDLDRMTEAERSRAYLREGIHEIRTHPKRVLWLLPRKVAVLFSPHSYLGMDWLYAAFVAFAPVGLLHMWVQRQHRKALWILAFPIAVLVAACLVTVGDVRYRQPIDPLLMILAALGMARFFPTAVTGLDDPSTP